MNFYSQITSELLIIGHSKTSKELKIKIDCDDVNSSSEKSLNKLSQNYQIHPDMLAVICLLAFPIETKADIIFPQPISLALAETLISEPFKLKVLSVNSTLYTYKQTSIGTGASQPNLKLGIAFGGGYDSLAVMTLLKNHDCVYVYHAGLETYKRDQAIIDLGRKLAPNNFHFVRSNARNLHSLGWSNWPAVLIPLLVMASKYHWSHLGLGGNIGSVYLKTGNYRPNQSGQWYRIFQTIGMPLFCPLAGVSEIGVVKILKHANTNLLDSAIYCQKTNGSNCQKCPKCIRRQLVTELIKTKKSAKKSPVITQSGPSLREQSLRSSGPSLDWLLNKTPRLSWVNRYYPQALDFQPSELRDLIKSALDEYLEPMTKSDILALESYKQR